MFLIVNGVDDVAVDIGCVVVVESVGGCGVDVHGGEVVRCDDINYTCQCCQRW